MRGNFVKHNLIKISAELCNKKKKKKMVAVVGYLEFLNLVNFLLMEHNSVS